MRWKSGIGDKHLGISSWELVLRRRGRRSELASGRSIIGVPLPEISNRWLTASAQETATRWLMVSTDRTAPLLVSNELLRRGERVGDGTGRIATSADEVWRPLVVIMMIFQAWSGPELKPTPSTAPLSPGKYRCEESGFAIRQMACRYPPDRLRWFLARN
jgi:hypothetical protein